MSGVVNILDNDLYKFIMHQFIFERYPDVAVTFGMTNRSINIRIADEIPIERLRDELDRIKEFRFNRNFTNILSSRIPGFFTKEYLTYLESKFKLSEYRLYTAADGQYHVSFPGKWLETTLWECMLLATVSELRTEYNNYDTDSATLLMTEQFMAKEAIIENYNELRSEGPVELSEFGTRRRSSQVFQEAILRNSPIFTSTSNVWLSYILDIPCKGTYAHEIPMVLTALADVWHRTSTQFEYPAYMYEKTGSTIVLPDTYGSTQFYDRFPNQPGMINHIPIWGVSDVRMDSKDPVAAGNEALTFFKDYIGGNAKKGLLFSDGLTAPAIVYLDEYFKKKANPKFGWGTDATNGTFGTASLVCKAMIANGEPCIKLSDRFSKATDSQFTNYYYDIFGTKGMV